MVCYIKKYWQISVLSLAVPFFVACSSERPGIDHLRELCERDAGVTINRTVEAEGYYDAEKKDGSLRMLLRSDYQYIEFCNDEPNLMSMLDKPGCGRYRRIAKDSGLCDPRLDEILDESVVEPYISFKKNYCVEFELIERPEAPYTYESHLDIWRGKIGISEFVRSETLIRDTYTSEVLGMYVSYSLNVNPGQSSPISCNRIDKRFPTFREAKLVEKVLKYKTN